MQDSLKEKIVRAFAVAILLAVFVAGLVFVRPDYLRSQSLKERNAVLRGQLKKLRRISTKYDIGQLFPRMPET